MMNSKLTFGIDWNNGNQPVIKIVLKKSDDHRDEMVQNFLKQIHDEKLKLEFISENYPNQIFDEHASQTYFIRPAPKAGEKDAYFRVMDNSDAFHEFLTNSKIEWKADGHQTLVFDNIDPFALGRKWQEYKFLATDGPTIFKHVDRICRERLPEYLHEKWNEIKTHFERQMTSVK